MHKCLSWYPCDHEFSTGTYEAQKAMVVQLTGIPERVHDLQYTIYFFTATYTHTVSVDVSDLVPR